MAQFCIRISVNYESFQRGTAASCLWVYVGGVISVSMAVHLPVAKHVGLYLLSARLVTDRMKGFGETGMVTFKVRRI